MPMTASVTVHVDKDGAMAITQNPTLAPAVQKSKHEPKAQETDVRVSSDTVKTLPFSWKHSLSCTRQLRKRNLPIMSKTECLLLFLATMYFQNW